MAPERHSNAYIRLDYGKAAVRRAKHFDALRERFKEVRTVAGSRPQRYRQVHCLTCNGHAFTDAKIAKR